MNKFETGVNQAAETVPAESPKNAPENLMERLKELKEEEEETLSPLKTAEKPTDSRLKKAVCVLTAAIALFYAAPGFAGERGPKKETQKIEQQIEELEQQIHELKKQKNKSENPEAQKSPEERLEQLNGYLGHEFKMNGLELGKPKDLVRGFYEQYGIYLDGKHLADIKPHGSVNFTYEDLIKTVSEVLEENK